MINSGAEMCLSVYLVGKRALICFAVFRWVSIKRAEIFNAFFSSSFSTVERPLHWAGNERPQNWLCCESQFVIKTFGEFVDVNTVIIRTELRQWEILKSIRNTRFICNWHVSCFVVQIKHRLTELPIWIYQQQNSQIWIRTKRHGFSSTVSIFCSFRKFSHSCAFLLVQSLHHLP